MKFRKFIRFFYLFLESHDIYKDASLLLFRKNVTCHEKRLWSLPGMGFQSILQQTASVKAWLLPSVCETVRYRSLASADEQEILKALEDWAFTRVPGNMHAAAKQVMLGSAESSPSLTRDLVWKHRWLYRGCHCIHLLQLPIPVVDGKCPAVFSPGLRIKEPIDTALAKKAGPTESAGNDW